MVRMKQTAQKGAAVPGTKGDKLHQKALKVAAAHKHALTLGLKQTTPFQPEQVKNRRKPGTLSLMEIRHSQKSDGCLIPLFAFGRLV